MSPFRRQPLPPALFHAIGFLRHFRFADGRHYFRLLSLHFFRLFHFFFFRDTIIFTRRGDIFRLSRHYFAVPAFSRHDIAFLSLSIISDIIFSIFDDYVID
jgi:hypothetical protein